MRIRHEDSEEGMQINLMPLIDMVFLLLIFFLVATTFARQERDLSIELPRTGAPKPLSAQPQQLIINVQADGSIVIAKEGYDLKRLGALLAQVARDEPGRQILIRADRRSLHEYFARVAALCQEVGINPANIGYLADKTQAQPIE